MEKVEFQILGVFGIEREVFNILFRSSRRKLLWALALTLLPPLSFGGLGLNFILGPLLLKIQEKQIEAMIHPDESTIRRELSSEWRELLVVVAAYTAFNVALVMLSTAAVVYTVASLYTANTKKLKLSYVRILSIDVPRVWKRMTITFLWFLIIFCGFMGASVFGIMLLFFFFFLNFPPTPTAVGGHTLDNLLKSSGTFLCGLILLIVVVFGLQLYIGTVFQLATVISVLEEKYYGLAAIVKSNRLIKGKRMTSLAVIIVNMIPGVVIGRLFIREGHSHGLGITVRVVYGILLVGLLCFLQLRGLLMQSVLYFVCKSYHHESIDDNSSLNVYNVGDYEPMKTGSVQLGHLHVDI